ncbi:uncharacterized protein LOC126373366 isoform X2 [Pectinophora gossypiella]|uniref:uncharacterized protein LOC126373366 isoform X2 n=1 Tax=Pectinophora gossypiella TaxID=13191 RepID=UPI00214E01D5|nr:uncharacterized protein LOC126373366 isoform X2 [Pectinophora gossypiella]
MVRWRLCLALAVMLMLPTRISCKSDDDEEEERGEEGEEDDDDDDDDDEEEGDKIGGQAISAEGNAAAAAAARRSPGVLATPKALGLAITRTAKKRPLECYVCAYKSETPLRACLDPTKFRVHTITCHSVDDKCFTSVISKGDSYEAVVRGCRSGCVGSPETTCCELNRCNNQAFAMPLIQPRSALTENRPSKTNKCLPPNVVFFITVLLVLQTVVKVAFV